MIKTLFTFICLVVLVPCVAAACDDNRDMQSCENQKLLWKIRQCNWCTETNTCHIIGSFKNKCGKVGSVVDSIAIFSCEDHSSEKDCKDNKQLGLSVCNWCDDGAGSCHAIGSFKNKCGKVGSVVDSIAINCGDHSSEKDCKDNKKLGLSVCNWCDDGAGSCHAKSSLYNPCKSWSGCHDFKDMSGCVGATKLLIKSCSWCIESQTCHTIGSTVNKCSKACCVSQGRLSRCPSSEVDVKLYCYPDLDTQRLNIVLDFVGGLTDKQKGLFEAQRKQVLCFLKGAVGKGNYEITIKAEAKAIDGEGGALGHAGSTKITTDPMNGYVRVLEGGMTFDTADVASMEKEGSFPDVILHEMLHVLGVGPLWEQNGCVEKGWGCTGQTYWNPETCPKAHEAYQSMGGEGAIPLEDKGGPGTACQHWKESVFKDEVITGYASAKPLAPLSKMTVQSLADIGYVVDPSCTRVTQGNIDIFGQGTSGAAYSASIKAMPSSTVEQSAEWWEERDTIKSFEVDTSSTNPPGQDQDQDADADADADNNNNNNNNNNNISAGFISSSMLSLPAALLTCALLPQL